MEILLYALYSRKDEKIITYGIVSNWTLNKAVKLIENTHRETGTWSDEDTAIMAAQLPLWRVVIILSPFKTGEIGHPSKWLEKRDGRWEWYEKPE